jgi:hypothetical protein
MEYACKGGVLMIAKHRIGPCLKAVGFCLFFACGCLMMQYSSTPSFASEGSPIMSVSEDTFDFGVVTEDKELSHNFIIENSGDAPLRILDIDADCSCTISEYDKVIPPGSSGKINLTLESFSVFDEFSKETIVRTNDPDVPELLLTLKGIAESFVDIQPTQIIRFNDPSIEVQTVQITSRLSIPWEITECKTNIPDNIQVELTTLEKGKVYQLQIKNNPKETNYYSGYIEIFHDLEQRPPLRLRVFAEKHEPGI